ncbi:hypothetical protein V493_02362 [Pseudogymnoascus sp. VKM F-4281 (FW-2241)]|nr:hypothetical protein V493_02362 [Pseudogymnoascus sp. VKM F-4281 (FW-2241)]
MKFTVPTIALVLSGTALAFPAAEQFDTRDDVQTVHLKFHGGPASFEMAFPADGTMHPTNHDFAVSIIDAPDYRALSDCTFHTAGEQTLVGGLSPEGVQQVIIGPPQPITGADATMRTTSGLAPAAMGTVLLHAAGLGSIHPLKVTVSRWEASRRRSRVRFGADVYEVMNPFKVP